MSKWANKEIQHVKPSPEKPGWLEVKAEGMTLDAHPECVERFVRAKVQAGFRGPCCTWETEFERQQREKQAV